MARASIFGLLVQSGVVVAPLSFDPRTAQAQDLAPRPLGVWLSRLRPLRPPGRRLYRLRPTSHGEPFLAGFQPFGSPRSCG